MITQKHIEQTRFFTTNGTDIWKVKDVSTFTLVELVNCETGGIASARVGERSAGGFVPVIMPKIKRQKSEIRGRKSEKKKEKPGEGAPAKKSGKKNKAIAVETGKPQVQYPSLRGDVRGCRAGMEAASKYIGVTVKGIKGGRPRYYAQSRQDGKWKHLGIHNFEEAAAAAVQEHLGNTEEAKRLRKLAERETDQKISQLKEEDKATAWDCTNCGAGYQYKPDKCGKCGGSSFTPARPEKEK